MFCGPLGNKPKMQQFTLSRQFSRTWLHEETWQFLLPLASRVVRNCVYEYEYPWLIKVFICVKNTVNANNQSGWIDLRLLSLLGGTDGLTIVSVCIIKMDDGLAGIYFHWYYRQSIGLHFESKWIYTRLKLFMVQDYSQALNTENACRVYSVESVSKMELVLSIALFATWSCMFNWPIWI